MTFIPRLPSPVNLSPYGAGARTLGSALPPAMSAPPAVAGRMPAFSPLPGPSAQEMPDIAKTIAMLVKAMGGVPEPSPAGPMPPQPDEPLPMPAHIPGAAPPSTMGNILELLAGVLTIKENQKRAGMQRVFQEWQTKQAAAGKAQERADKMRETAVRVAPDVMRAQAPAKLTERKRIMDEYATMPEGPEKEAAAVFLGLKARPGAPGSAMSITVGELRKSMGVNVYPEKAETEIVQLPVSGAPGVLTTAVTTTGKEAQTRLIGARATHQELANAIQEKFGMLQASLKLAGIQFYLERGRALLPGEIAWLLARTKEAAARTKDIPRAAAAREANLRLREIEVMTKQSQKEENAEGLPAGVGRVYNELQQAESELNGRWATGGIYGPQWLPGTKDTARIKELKPRIDSMKKKLRSLGYHYLLGEERVTGASSKTPSPPAPTWGKVPRSAGVKTTALPDLSRDIDRIVGRR